MEISTLDAEAIAEPLVDAHPLADAAPFADLERLGDAIAELSAHLEAATARLLDLIREFDARGGWNSGFRSCAHWLSWRVGVNLGAARERAGWPGRWGRSHAWRARSRMANCPTPRCGP